MNVSCPDCQSVFRLDPAKVTSETLRARCSVCGGIISVGAGARWSEAFADVPQRVVTLPPTTEGRLADHVASPVERSTPIGSRPVLPGDGATGRLPVPAAATSLEGLSSEQAASAPAVGPAGAEGREPIVPRWPVVTQEEAAAASAERLPPEPAKSEGPLTEPVAAPLPVPPQPLVARLTSAAPLLPVVPRRVVPAATDRSPLATPRRLTPIGGHPSHHRGPTRPASPAFGAPLPRTSIPTPVGSPISGQTVGSAPTSGRRPINPFLTNDPNQKARRLARALVSDMIAYHPAKREDGLRNGTLKQLFREEIKKSYEEYVEQIGREFAEGTTHFQDALNEVLSGGRKLF